MGSGWLYTVLYWPKNWCQLDGRSSRVAGKVCVLHFDSVSCGIFLKTRLLSEEQDLILVENDSFNNIK